MAISNHMVHYVDFTTSSVGRVFKNKLENLPNAINQPGAVLTTIGTPSGVQKSFLFVQGGMRTPAFRPDSLVVIFADGKFLDGVIPRVQSVAGIATRKNKVLVVDHDLEYVGSTGWVRKNWLDKHYQVFRMNCRELNEADMNALLRTVAEVACSGVCLDGSY